MIHQVVMCSLLSCGEAAKESQKLPKMAKRAIEVLYNASLISESPYMEKLSAIQKQFRQKIIQWGGFAAMFYVDRNAKALKEVCEKLGIRKYVKGKKLKATINSVRMYLRSKDSGSLPAIQSPDDKAVKREILFPKYPH